MWEISNSRVGRVAPIYHGPCLHAAAAAAASAAARQTDGRRERKTGGRADQQTSGAARHAAAAPAGKRERGLNPASASAAPEAPKGPLYLSRGGGGAVYANNMAASAGLHLCGRVRGGHDDEGAACSEGCAHYKQLAASQQRRTETLHVTRFVIRLGRRLDANARTKTSPFSSICQMRSRLIYLVCARLIGVSGISIRPPEARVSWPHF